MISVIVPVYKVELYLERCIKSLIGQTFQDFEIILVDDGSPDSCPQICDYYAETDPRIRVIHKKNSGLSDARNVGIEASKGSFLSFVDSDDIVNPHYLEYLYRAALEDHCDLVVCGYRRFEEKPPVEECQYVKGNIYSGTEMIRRIYSKNHNEAVESTVSWNKLYRRQLFDGVRFPSGKIHEDEATTYQVYWKANRITVIPCILYYYFRNPEGIMNQKCNISRLDYLEALRNRASFFKEHELPDLADQTLQLFYTYTVDFASIKKKEIINYPAFRRRLKELYRKERMSLFRQKTGFRNKIRILLSFIQFDCLTAHFPRKSGEIRDEKEDRGTSAGVLY